MNGRPFTDVIGEIENGQLLRDLTEQVYKIVEAALDTRKPGTLSLALKFSPTGRGSVEIDAKYDAKIPEHARPTTTFFTTPDGTLLRDDPNQPKLPLRAVDMGDGRPLRDIG